MPISLLLNNNCYKNHITFFLCIFALDKYIYRLLNFKIESNEIITRKNNRTIKQI